MNRTITKRIAALEATPTAPATDRTASMARVLARADAMLAGTPYPPGAPITDPATLAHRARMIAAIRRNDAND